MVYALLFLRRSRSRLFSLETRVFCFEEGATRIAQQASEVASLRASDGGDEDQR